MIASTKTASVTPIPGEGDVVKQAILTALRNRNVESAARFDESFKSWPQLPVAANIRDANRYWRRQLAALPIDTTEVRECLIDDCAWVDWLRHFTQGVLPTIIAFNLPIL